MKPVQLPSSTFKPYPFQTDSVDLACDLIHSNPEIAHLFSSPTGTGKSIMELRILERMPGGILITPRIEIIQGMLKKLGDYDEDESIDATVTRAWQYGIITPIRFRNMLARGELGFRPHYLILDESHHDLAASWQDIHMYLNGVPKLGFTATPYRGTPQGTREFYEHWNDTINVCITLRDAIASGYCSLPTATTVPLVDDDVVSLTAGEFKIAQVDAMVFDRIKYLVDLCKPYWCPKSLLWDRPTMFSVSSSVIAARLTTELNAAGMKAECVTQSTSNRDRKEIFKRVINLRSILVQIDVISEGVDLPIRRLIDVKPTMSPVRWVQQIGRIMRPIARCEIHSRPYPVTSANDCGCEQPPEYICCCRNMERHAYLMEGLLPNSSIKEAQEAFTDKQGFPMPSSRSGQRVVGLEGMGKFVRTPVPLSNGITIFTYHLVRTEGFQRNEYFAIVHPNNPTIVIGEKQSTKNENNEYNWGKWRMLAETPDLTGCISAKASPLTPKQEQYWKAAGGASGLNTQVPVNNRMFSILPFLRNTGLSFR